MPKLTKTEDELRLSLSGAGDFQTALAQAKSIYPRRFNPDTKDWVYPLDSATAEKLLLMVKPSADAALLQWVRASRAEREKELTTKLPDDADDLMIPWRDKLYGYQRAFVRFAADNPRVLLADDMGLGKTLQAISSVAEFLIRADDIDISRPRLVVAPNSAKGVWARELVKWLGSSVPHQIVDAKTPKRREAQLEAGIKDAGGWVIVNYEQVRAQKFEDEHEVHHRDGSTSVQVDTEWRLKQPLFGTTDWLAVIADEAHRIKSRKAAQTRGMWKIDAPLKLALTGTPLANSPAELWSLLVWLYPEQYGKSTKGHHRTAFWAFHDEYVESYEGYKNSKVIIGVKNPDGLRFELKNRLVRRTKAEKLNLPEKTREYVPLTMGDKQAKAYSQVETKFWAEIVQAVQEGDKDAQRFAQAVVEGRKRLYEIPNGAARLVRQRQVLCSPALLGADDDSIKMDAIVEAILDNSHQQHLVFTEFVMGANLFVERLRKKGVEAEAFTGEVADTVVRTSLEDRFQSGSIDVLVGTIGAMRESLTLHAANIQHWSERAWVPAWNEQGEDRSHRVGQTNPVTILIYEVEGTVDTQKVRPTNQLKELIVSSVIKKDKIAEAV